MKLTPFDKYSYYMDAVQDPAQTNDHVLQFYREIKKKTPTRLREDFCGTAGIACDWVKRGKKFEAIGVDLDPEPLQWGLKYHVQQLSEEQRKRVTLIKTDVRNPRLKPADIILAMNFSFFIFKKRNELLKYFKNCRKTLRKDGLLMLDCFGGTETWEANEEKTKHKKYTYFWDQTSFDPVSHESLFHIHFHRKGEKRRDKVFTYDWRMWTLPELRDLLEDAGFKKSYVYWEGEDENEEGTGEFSRVKSAENCLAWVAYLVAEK